jgi:hypothetical protein
MVRLRNDTKLDLDDFRAQLAEATGSAVMPSLNVAVKHLLEFHQQSQEARNQTPINPDVIGKQTTDDNDAFVESYEEIGLNLGTGDTETVGRPTSIVPEIKLLLDALFSGAYDRGIDLQFSGRISGRRWLSHPDRFMSVEVQTRNKVLLIIIYGTPENYVQASEALQIKADRPSYSRFHIKRLEQIPIALDIIERSLELRSRNVFKNNVGFQVAPEIDFDEMSTRSVLAVPVGRGRIPLIGQQIRSLNAKRCLVVTTGNEMAQNWQEQLYRQFGLTFQLENILQNDDEVDLGRPSRPLTIITHPMLQMDIASLNSDVTLHRDHVWDLVVVDSIDDLIDDERWAYIGTDLQGRRNPLRNIFENSGVARHSIAICSPKAFMDPILSGKIRKLIS